VAAGGGIENGDVLLVAVDADHGRRQVAGIDDQARTRLQNDLEPELTTEGLDGTDQRGHVISCLADEMPTTEVHSLDAPKVRCELAGHMPDKVYRAVVQGLAQRVHVEDIDRLPRQPLEILL